jgi:fucose permease
MSRPRILLPSLASLAFVSLGLPDGVLGTAWPSMRASFGLPLDAQGAILVAFTIGYVTASFGTGTLLARVSLGRLLAASGLATGLALLGYAASPAFWMLMALALLLGAGGGVIDASINTWASTHHGLRTLNWLHACWGAGAALGPAIVVLALESGRSWRVAYAAVGVAQLALAGGFALTSRAWPPVTPSGEGGVSAGLTGTRATLCLRGARLGGLAYFLYTGIEVGFGVWAFTLFTEGRGIAPATAGFWLSVYWGGFTVGRLLTSAAARSVAPAGLVRGCLAGAAVGSALVWVDGNDAVAFAGLTLVGLSLAPVFPTLMATTPRRVPPAHVANTVGLQVAAAAVGAAVLPASLGVVAQRLGLETLGPQLLTLSIAAFALHEVLARSHAP